MTYRPRAKASTTARGYGTAHVRLRAWYAPLVAQGLIPCARCGQTITGAWDLGHTPDRSGWTGPEHRKCNRSEGATRGNRARGFRRARLARVW